MAPAVWEAELANVPWMATRHNVLTIGEAPNRLALADGLGIHAVPNRKDLPLATFDARLLKAFPATVSARDHIYLIDPLGNLMMRFPKDADPARMVKDLKRLLKISRIG